MSSVLIGRYIKGDSYIHRLDPRLKLILTFLFIFIIFLANNWLTYGLLAAYVLLVVLLTGVPLGTFLRGVQPMVFLILFTVILQLFFTQGGTVYWQWGIFSITSDGIQSAIFIFIRFVLIIFMSTVLTLTTSPLEITDGLESLMSPFKSFLPIHEIALMLSIALRFVPTLMDETTKIMNAQRARGVDFGEGNLIQRVKALVPVLVPLFVSSFNRADDLATAMEARGYKGGEGRSKYRILEWSKQDNLTIIAFLFLFALLFWLRS